MAKCQMATEVVGKIGVLWGSIAGFLFYAGAMALAEALSSAPLIGEFVYNYYFLSLLEGLPTVPIQIIGLEGHYDAMGRAYVYHGLAPLLTRALAWPFVDLSQTDIRLLTIWLFASAGTAFYYSLLVAILRTVATDGQNFPKGTGAFLWVLIWVTSPGALLVSNGSFFHEPIAVAYAMLAAFLWCLWNAWRSRWQFVWLVVGMALLAAVAVHARPHVALGMYLVTGLAGLLTFRARGTDALVPTMLAAVVLAAAGVLYISLNTLRFGDGLQVDGSVNAAARVVYGFVYWGFESEDSPRFRAALENGRFNAWRVLPNFVMYHLSMGGNLTIEWFRAVTAGLGDIRLEYPMVGLLFVWPLWVLLGLSAFVRNDMPKKIIALMLLAVLPGVLLVYSYPTITARYRVELFPLWFVLGAAALATMAARGSYTAGASACKFAVVVLAVGVFTTASVFESYSDYINWEWGTFLRSFEACRDQVSAHPGLGPDRVEDLCVIDD